MRYKSGKVQNAIVDWCSFCHDVCEELLRMTAKSAVAKMMNHYCREPLKFFYRKYHCGQWTDGHWALRGVVERETGKCFLMEVEDEFAATLVPIIERFILLGITIISDGWHVYRNLEEIGDGVY